MRILSFSVASTSAVHSMTLPLFGFRTDFSPVGWVLWNSGQALVCWRPLPLAYLLLFTLSFSVEWRGGMGPCNLHGVPAGGTDLCWACSCS